MKLTCAATVVLSALHGSNGFIIARSLIKVVQTVATSSTVSMVGDGFSDDFLEALSPGTKNEEGSEEEEEDVASGSSRFKDLLKASRQRGASGAQKMPQSIENPFLNPSSSTVANPIQFLSTNPDELSVEEQAKLFREMMSQQQDAPPVEPQRVARTDRAGRPVGRNRDADTISNAADVYFAQLKRDSTVRALARIRGEDDIAEKVFEDEGIKQLDDLLKKNPYLKGQREKDMELIDEIPEEALAPYFKSSEPSEEEKSKSGPSYRQKLMERTLKQKQGGANSQDNSVNAAISDVSSQSGPSPASPVEASDMQAEPVTQQNSIKEPTFPTQHQTLPVPQASIAQQQPSSETDQSTVSANPEDARQKIRTLMGLILKHRGGPGFGKGRLKGAEIVRFESLLQEVSALLREEANDALPLDTHLPSMKPATTSIDMVTTSPPEVPSPPEVSVTHARDASAAGGGGSASANVDIDSTIACIEGAITMYKNSPPELQQSVLVMLRAALVSAVGTCNTILAAQPPPAMPGNPDGRIENTISMIEGAITMYKNSPSGLKESVLVTLRAALISAVETCTIVLGTEQQLSFPPPPVTEHSMKITYPVAGTPPVIVDPPSPDPSSSTDGNDLNSKRLEEIYDKVQSASGDGRLGLNSELMPSEAEELADELVEMRRILMHELELGVSQPESVLQATGGEKSSTGPKYQQLLAKARAEKAAG